MRYTKDFKYISIDLNQEWTALFNPKNYNWVDFHIIKIMAEADRKHGTWDLEIYFLGLGIRFYGVYSKQKNMAAMEHYEKILAQDEWVEIK